MTCALAALPNFDPTGSASWLIADGGSLVAFSGNKFTVNDTAFTPGAEGGAWAVTNSGGDLFLSFAPGAAVDLSVSATDSPDPAPVGDSLTYTITVNNNSPHPPRFGLDRDLLNARRRAPELPFPDVQPPSSSLIHVHEVVSALPPFSDSSNGASRETTPTGPSSTAIGTGSRVWPRTETGVR
jgi:hypothetical protein